MKRVLCLIMMIVTGVVFAGCSNAEDAKKYDIQKAGEEIVSQIESASQMT